MSYENYSQVLNEINFKSSDLETIIIVLVNFKS